MIKNHSVNEFRYSTKEELYNMLNCPPSQFSRIKNKFRLFNHMLQVIELGIKDKRYDR